MYPADKQVFFQGIYSMLPYILCSVLCDIDRIFHICHKYHSLFGFIIFFKKFISLCNVSYRIFAYYFFFPLFFYDFYNISSHPLLFCFPFDSLYFIQLLLCDRYFELYPLLVHFLCFSWNFNIFWTATRYFTPRVWL